PLALQDSYIDKNCNDSLKLQAVVTTHKIFTNIMVGYPGSAHDSRVTCFRDKGHLNNRQNCHNTCHSITRVVVEHTFGLLKSRWRILRLINVNSVEKAIKIIVACCLLST
ncbi:hypothetical protein NQ315_002592, partial [Exocentrus adspersus]